MTSDKLSENETKKLEELDKILSENPELKNMSMDEIIGMLNLSETDKSQLRKQVNDIGRHRFEEPGLIEGIPRNGRRNAEDHG